MGGFFGIALILIIFAGAELFSGHIMYMTFGFLYRRVGFFTAIKDWIICWYGNLFGAVILSFLFAAGGGGGWMADRSSLVHQLADSKMHSGIQELLARAIICNWLLCLAIWMASKTKDDTAKMGLGGERCRRGRFYRYRLLPDRSFTDEARLNLYWCRC
jgi:nitrite transporter NirC